MITLLLVILSIFQSYLALYDQCECGLEFARSRVSYGRDFEERKYPWLSFLRMKNDDMRWNCAASVVGKKTLATAAHCVFAEDGTILRPDQIEVFLGAHHLEKLGQPKKVEKIIVDQKYKNGNFQLSGHDIAILVVENEISDPSIMPICVPLTKNAPYVSQFLTVVGWGLTEEGEISIPREGKLLHLTFFECIRRKQEYLTELGFESDSEDDSEEVVSIPKTDICARNYKTGVDACEGDSGGPLMWKAANNRWYLLGVVSRGSDDCGEKDGFPGLYTRAREFFRRRYLKGKFDHSDICYRRYEL